MPEVDGLHLARELLLIDPKIIILFLTAYGSAFEREFRETFPGLGWECYIRKPVTAAALAKSIL